jgi:hypothetical protein
MTHISLNHFMAREHARGMGARAARRTSADRLASSGVTLRRSGPADAPALHTLALLDSAPDLHGPALVAIIDGDLRAALPLDGGAPIANPFHRTAEILELLRSRASQLGLA